MKYKAGDKVRIRKDLVVGQWYGGIFAVQPIVDLGGTEQIANPSTYNYFIQGFYMSEEMFEDTETTIVDQDDMKGTVSDFEFIYSEDEVKQLCHLAMEFSQERREFAYELIEKWFNQNKKK